MKRLALLAVIVAGCGSQHGSAPPPPDAATAECRTVDAVVLVHLDPARWPDIIGHVQRATDRDGRPRHLHIDRADADVHRAAALAGIPTKTGFDRDEYPPAMSLEGGADSTVEYVPSSENRSQGSAMGAALSGFCEGQMFELVTP
jgi:hypothetical protein